MITVNIHQNGGLVVNINNNIYTFKSKFSQPVAKWNFFDVVGSQTIWNVSWKNIDYKSIIAYCDDYSVERTFDIIDNTIKISDKITNTRSNKPLGLMVKHEIDVNYYLKNIRLAGIQDPSVTTYYSPSNPSVYVEFDRSAIGIVCEDKVFRSQNKLYYNKQNNIAGIRTETLRIGVGETYTLTWSIYLLPDPNYYRFINFVRKDWHINQQIPGSWLWGYDPDIILSMNEEKLRLFFNKFGIKVAIVGGGWIDKTKNKNKIGFGAAVLDDYWSDYRGRIKLSVQKIKKLVPGSKVLLYYNSQRDSSDGDPNKYSDSWITDINNKPITTDWNGMFQTTYRMIATLNNNFGKRMLDVVDCYLNEIGVDGLYWDEMESTSFNFTEITYNIKDGNSCRLNPFTFDVDREIGFSILLGEQHRLSVINKVLSKDGIILGNGPTCMLSTNQIGVFRMIEIQNNQIWKTEGHTGSSPLGYLSSNKQQSVLVNAIQNGFLPIGIDYNTELISILFPFTVLEILDGCIIGKERIVSVKSGTYGWVGEVYSVKIYKIDSNGNIYNYSTIYNVKSLMKIDVPYGEICILERIC